jgi:hypothetical protein
MEGLPVRGKPGEFGCGHVQLVGRLRVRVCHDEVAGREHSAQWLTKGIRRAAVATAGRNIYHEKCIKQMRGALIQQKDVRGRTPVDEYQGPFIGTRPVHENVTDKGEDLKTQRRIVVTEYLLRLTRADIDFVHGHGTVHICQ